MSRYAKQDRTMLARTLELARLSLREGSSPIGCVIVNASGQVVAEGRNRSGETWPKKPHEIAGSGLAHAEMVAFYRAGSAITEAPETLTLYTSLEPCLMCGGAIGMLGLRRVVWACDDPWGGSGRLIAWNEHPAFTKIRVSPHPDADLERQAAELFAPEVKRVYPARGWQAWQKRYPEICAAVPAGMEDKARLRGEQRHRSERQRRGQQGAA